MRVAAEGARCSPTALRNLESVLNEKPFLHSVFQSVRGGGCAASAPPVLTRNRSSTA